MSENKKENLNLQWARYYTQTRKWSVIPLSPGIKIPPKGFDVITYRTRIASDEELQKWFADPKMNIGIITGGLSDLFVVDLDKGKKEKYREENALQYFGDDIKTLVVDTPSGGQHYFFTYPGHNITIAENVLPAIDYRGEGGYVAAPPSVNGNGKPYVWTKGFKEYSLGNAPDSFIDFITDKSIIKNKNISTNIIASSVPQTLQTLHDLQFLQEGTRDRDLFHVSNCLAKGGFERELADKVIEIIANSCNPPFPYKEAIAKVDSAYGRVERRERNLTQEIRDYCSLQDSYINLTDAYETLQILHSSEKAACQVVFHRLCKDGTLEKVSRGTFKKIETDCSDIDFWDTDVTPMTIKYPLDIHEYVDTYPKNIIVVAGEPDSGKTAFLLNFAKKNMDKHEVIYFSSEMGKIELRHRLEKFNMPLENWRKVIWKERASDFASMIRPNAVNVIDFLEIHQNFYEVGMLIKQIFDKLENGIAMIALQKPKGRDEGLGGQRGLEKPRLYLSMSPGQIKIVKGKNWKHDQINPNGLMLNWKLVGGCNFVVGKDESWKR